MNENLPFVIPSNQSNQFIKWGGKGYTYFGDKSNFEQHKAERVQELNAITSEISSEKPKLKNPEQLVFLDITLDPKATSKSSLPTELFDKFNLDVNVRVAANEVIVAGTDESVADMEEAIRGYKYTDYDSDPANYKNSDAALLSSVAKISRVDKARKMDEADLRSSGTGLVYFYKSISEVNALKIQHALDNDFDIKSKYLVSPSGAKILVGDFNKNDLDVMINSDYSNPFAKYEAAQRIGVETKSLKATYPMQGVDVDTENANTVIGIIDSGIEELDVFKGLIVGRKDYSSNQNSDKHHGTMVASRVIFGNDIEDQLYDHHSLTAKAKVVDIKVLDGDDGPTTTELISYIEDAINEFPEIRVYNLSVGTSELCRIDKKSYFTRELDALSHQYGVLFVTAAGNIEHFPSMSYPDVLLDDDSRINPPADNSNNISVASLADKASNGSLAQVNEPSPFSRVGFDGLRKPDLAHFGGNARQNGVYRNLGSVGLDTIKDGIYEDIGTSFAAPLVTHEVAQLMNVIDKSGYPKSIDLTKALLIHSAGYLVNESSSINPAHLDKIVGHGIPQTSDVLFSDESKAVFVISGKVGGINSKTKKREAVQKIRFTIPDELKLLKRNLNVRTTLAYTAPIDSNDEIDPALTEVSITLHKLNSRKKLVNSAKQDISDYNYKPKWQTIKTLERTYTGRAYSNGDWEVSLSLLTRGDADRDDYEQPFALIISIEDAGLDDKKVNIQEAIRVNHQQYVRITDIPVRQRV